jgi:hypothetical protein
LAIEKAVQPYARGDGFAIPKAAYVVAAAPGSTGG